MRRATGLVLTFWLGLSAGIGCQKVELPELGRPLGPRRAGRTPDKPAAQPPWLDATKKLERREVFKTQAGVELREAQYAAEGGTARQVVLLRDYAARLEGKADLQWVLALDPDGKGRRLSLPEGALPVHLLTGPGHQSWGAVTFPSVPRPEPTAATPDAKALADNAAGVPSASAALPPDTEADRHLRGYVLDAAGFAVYVPGSLAPVAVPPAGPSTAKPDGAAALPPVEPPVGLKAVALGDALCPLGYSGDKLLFCRTLTAAAVAGGSILPKVDWTTQAEYVPLDGGEITLTADPAYIVSADGAAAVGMAPAAEQADGPAWQLYCWTKQGATTSRAVASLPAPAAGFAPWVQPVAWLLPRMAAVLSVLPPAPESAGAGPSFRLLGVDTTNGAQRLLADHLMQGTSVRVSDGVVFYALPLPLSGTTQRWEVWASGGDGLVQRLVYATPDAVAVTVADAWDGRLLLIRQYFDDGNGDPELRSQLVELAQQPLPASTVDWALLGSPLGRPRLQPLTGPGSKGKGPSGPIFIPDDEGLDPGGKYDRKGDSSGGGGDGPGGPPDITLPGL